MAVGDEGYYSRYGKCVLPIADVSAGDKLILFKVGDKMALLPGEVEAGDDAYLLKIIDKIQVIGGDGMKCMIIGRFDSSMELVPLGNCWLIWDHEITTDKVKKTASWALDSAATSIPDSDEKTAWEVKVNAKIGSDYYLIGQNTDDPTTYINVCKISSPYSSRTTTEVAIPAALSPGGAFDYFPYYGVGIDGNLIVGIKKNDGVNPVEYWACQITPGMIMTALQDITSGGYENNFTRGDVYIAKYGNLYVRWEDGDHYLISTSPDGITWTTYLQSDIFSGPI